MGKSNRIRADRANKNLSAPVKLKAKKKKGMPLWLKTLIAAIVAVVIFGVFIIGMLSSSGVFMRLSTAMKSDHYRVSGNMMSYYYNTNYQNFQSNYSSYMSYFSLDTTTSLKDQQFGDTSKGNAMETNFLGEFDGTWFDYFMNSTEAQVAQILVYCEEAHERGIELTDEEIDSIDANMEALKTTASMSGTTVNSYISSIYGKGVSVNDVKKALKLTKLAEKCMTELQEEVLDGISNEDIEGKYNENKIDFNLVDYSYYTKKINFTDVAAEVLGSDYTEAELKADKDKVLEEYKKQINEAKTMMAKLESFTTVEEFNKYIYNTLADDYYDDKLEATELEDEYLPTDENVKKTIKEKLIASVIADLIADKDETNGDSVSNDDKYTIYEQEITKEFAAEIDTIKESIFTSLKNDRTKYVLEKMTYTEDNEFSEWAFDDERAAGDTTTIMTGDGSEGDEISDDEGSFTTSVYFLTKTQYCDEELSKNVIYMVFTTEAAAKEAIEEFKAGTISKEAFEELAESLGASNHYDYENYTKGSLGADDFDTWLYDDETAVGDYSETPIKADDSAFLVAFYYEDGIPNWKVTVENALFSERYESAYEEMEKVFEIKTKDRVCNRINEVITTNTSSAA